jgi:hypothetical protein
MELDIFMLSEIRQAWKDKYHVISLTCGLKKEVVEAEKRIVLEERVGKIGEMLVRAYQISIKPKE